ncbi:MAG: ABC transporter permease, partial [Tepidisphaeraceae bacterium]
FSRIIRIEMPHYWAYLIVGILPFQFVQNAIAEGSSAVRKNAGLIRKVYIPMEILVIAGVTVKLVEFLAQLAVAIALLAVAHHGEWFGFSAWRTLVILPWAVLLLYLFVLGVALPLAAWTVIYRDLEHMVTLALMMLLYLTPIFWSLSLLEGNRWKWAFMLNPVMHFLDLFRGPLYWGTSCTLWTWVPAVFFAVTAFVGGYALFDRSKHVLAEVV